MSGLMHLTVDKPALLGLLVLVCIPWLTSPRLRSAWPWLGNVPLDRASIALDYALCAIASFAFAAFALAAAGLSRESESIDKISRGAHIALVIDRSSSMNDTFGGSMPDAKDVSKATAAKRLLQSFIARREHDRVGIVAFSTAPMFVLPLTDHHEALRAAIDAIDLPGLAYTDVARGLAMALSMFDESDVSSSRVVVLVSDGAAVIDLRVQERLRAAVAAHPIRLYWLFLRTAGGPGIFDQPDADHEDTPQEMPERHLHLFFSTLGVPYRAFEASDADGIARAIDEIDRTESAPLHYRETVPRKDLGGALFALAAFMVALLLAAKLAEVRVVTTEPDGDVRWR